MDIGFILLVILIGAVAGYVARMLVPGSDNLGVVGTIVLGIVGAIVGSAILNLLIDKSDRWGLTPLGLLGAILGAVLALFVFRAVSGRSRTTV